MNLKRLVVATAAAAFLSITTLSGASPASAGPVPPNTARFTTITLTPAQLWSLPYNNGMNTIFSSTNVWDDDPASIGATVAVRWTCTSVTGTITESATGTIATVNQPLAGAVLPYTNPLSLPCSLSYTYPTAFGTPTMSIRPQGGGGLINLSIRHY